MMMRGFLLISLLALSACGFRPVHGADLSGAGVSSIQIAQIDGRSGHVLRRDLGRELATGLPGVDQGLLQIELRETLVRLPLTPDGSAARTDIRAQANYALDTGEDVITGEVRAESAFNVPTQAFADISAQTSASERAMRILAQRISEDLRLKLAVASR